MVLVSVLMSVLMEWCVDDIDSVNSFVQMQKVNTLVGARMCSGSPGLGLVGLGCTFDGRGAHSKSSARMPAFIFSTWLRILKARAKSSAFVALFA